MDSSPEAPEGIANPSMAELAKGGTSARLVTASARIRPRARSSGTSSPAQRAQAVQDDLPGGLDWSRLGHGPNPPRHHAVFPSVAHRSLVPIVRTEPPCLSPTV